LEQALLGAIFIDNRAFDHVSGLEPEHFFEPIHQKIFEIVSTLVRDGKIATPVTVKPYLPRKLNVQGVLKQEANGKFDLDQTRQCYIRHLRERRPKSGADEQWRAARAREIEVRTAEREGRLIAVGDSLAAQDVLCGVVVEKLVGLPARHTRDVGERQRLDDLVFTIHTEIANEMARIGAALREGKNPDIARRYARETSG
jgi:hypothetical protein